MSLTYTFEKSFADLYRNIIKIQSKLGLKPLPPRYIIWDCTRRCNLNCEHCGAADKNYNRELDTQKVKQTLNNLYASVKGKGMFAVTGGEPLLRKDLLEILKYAKDKNFNTGIATNGYLVNKSLAKKISDIGVDSIMVSIDGPKEIHNKIRRNEKSFERAINALKKFKDSGIQQLTVSTTVTTTNLKSLNSLKDTIRKINPTYWRINLLMPIGRASEDKKLFLKPSQINNFLQFVYKNKKEFNILVGENLPYLGPWEKKIRDKPYTCFVGITTLCIGVNGNIRGCPEQPDLPKFIEGNIKEKSIMEIWNEGFIKYRQHEILRKDIKCKACSLRHRCWGGCWVMREGGSQCIKEVFDFENNSTKKER